MVCITAASDAGNCVPEANTTPLDGEQIPQIASGSAGSFDVMSVQVLPSTVLNSRCSLVIVPTQPSVGLVKLMQRR